MTRGFDSSREPVRGTRLLLDLSGVEGGSAERGCCLSRLVSAPVVAAALDSFLYSLYFSAGGELDERADLITMIGR